MNKNKIRERENGLILNLNISSTQILHFVSRNIVTKKPRSFSLAQREADIRALIWGSVSAPIEWINDPARCFQTGCLSGPLLVFNGVGAAKSLQKVQQPILSVDAEEVAMTG